MKEKTRDNAPEDHCSVYVAVQRYHYFVRVGFIIWGYGCDRDSKSYKARISFNYHHAMPLAV